MVMQTIISYFFGQNNEKTTTAAATTTVKCCISFSTQVFAETKSRYVNRTFRKVLSHFSLKTQHENGDIRKIKVCVNLRKVGYPTLRKLSTARKGL